MKTKWKLEWGRGERRNKENDNLNATSTNVNEFPYMIVKYLHQGNTSQFLIQLNPQLDAQI